MDIETLFGCVCFALFALICLPHAAKMLLRWHSFSKQGVVAQARIEELRQQKNKTVADITFTGLEGNTVATTVTLKDPRYTPGMDLEITYRQDNPVKCVAGDARTLRLFPFLGSLLFPFIVPLLILNNALVRQITGIGFILACLLLVFVLVFSKKRQRILHEQGMTVEGRVSRTVLERIFMRIEVNYTTTEQAAAIKISQDVAAGLEDGAVIPIRYNVSNPFRFFWESDEDTTTHEEIIATEGRIQHIQEGTETTSWIHYTVLPHTYTITTITPQYMVYLENDPVSVHYLPSLPSLGSLAAPPAGESGRKKRNAHKEIYYSVLPIIFTVLFFLAPVIRISEEATSSSNYFELILAASLVVFGLPMLYPFVIWKKHYKTHGIPTTAVIVTIGNTLSPSSLVLQYFDHNGSQFYTLVAEVAGIEHYQIGQNVEIRYWNKHPECVILAQDRALLQKTLFILGVFELLVGLSLILLMIFT